MFGDDPTQRAIEPRDRVGHVVRSGLPQPRRALDVGEQQRHCPVGNTSATLTSLSSISLMLASMWRTATAIHQPNC